MIRPVITHDRLTSIVRYCPDDGLFVCLVQRGSRRVGDIVGNVGNHGYIQLALDKRMYLGHRVAWFYMTKAWSSVQIDHANGIKTDNRWGNLREASAFQNAMNTPMYSRNRSGYRGVSWNKSRKKWCAFIKANGVQKWLGAYDDPAQAHQAYLQASCQLFGEFARQRHDA